MKVSDVRLKVDADDAQLAVVFDEWIETQPDDVQAEVLARLARLVAGQSGQYKSAVKGLGIQGAKALMIRYFLFMPLAVAKAREIVKGKPVRGDVDVAVLQGVK